ncbi:hypothetical protein HKBW3C_02687 [Candidatus Hakubella thermalkaliphila]|nr:hypothetical protein HKBW3C_02687 [Candidatus Hakubella thermalkaliphila]
MTKKRLSMRKIKEALRLKALGLTNRQIARSVKVSRSTVAEYLRRAEEASLAWPLPEGLDDASLERLLFPPQGEPKDPKVLPDFSYIHTELKRKGVTLKLLWEEYLADHPGGYNYSHLCYLYRTWRDKLSLSMRQIHKAGEKMFVDFAGQTVPVVDARTGEINEAQVFVAVQGASNYTYAEATWSQDLESWISCHTHAFSFFGGVTRITVPDNLASGVTKACRYEPDINPTYHDMALYYGTVVIPARVAKPKDKAKAEAGVQVVERWILARLRNRTFFSLSELNQAIAELLENLNNRPLAKLEGTRRTLFEKIDLPALLPLPLTPYEFAEFRKATVNVDYHIEVFGHYYSIPHQLVKERVEVRVTQRVVEVLFKGRRVTSHLRSYLKGGHSTKPEHMPKAHQKYLEWSPSRIINWAGKIGPETARLVEAILAKKPHPEQGYRACLGLIRLSKAYSQKRLEAASRRALEAGALSYRSVKQILKNNLDTLSLKEEQKLPPIDHDNIRGPDYYH